MEDGDVQKWKIETPKNGRWRRPKMEDGDVHLRNSIG